MDVLITDCMASGVKLAGQQYGRLYGTREIAIVSLKGGTYKDSMRWRWRTKS